uniref:Zf-LYAR domain-containing protein n=1 Tax=Parastrongyloides trichosuri TaxID=131310 RepID=A0A0N4ZX17_PARTI
MVFFACDNCGESLKKNAVEKHFYRCKNATYSCMDCQVSFDKISYATHLKCVSEQQRYGGSNFVSKENKGEIKQNAWCEQVSKAIENVKEEDLKCILRQVSKFDNIPRKQAKFLNFLSNSLRIKDRNLCERAWKAIEVEAIKMREEAVARSEIAKLKAKEEKEAKEKAKKESENLEQNVSCTNFKWKKRIKRKLAETEDGCMKLKKLKKIIVNEYLTTDTKIDINEAEEIFDKKLISSGLIIDDKLVRLEV